MKTCFKCKMTLPIAEFYRHPKMGDGHLGKCKTCTKKDTASRAALKSATDLEWVFAERERCRIKARESRSSNKTSRSNREYRKRNPIKWAAHILVNNAIRTGKLVRKLCEVCGKKAHAHHDDYLKPLEVRWLCPKHHGEHHRKINDAKIIERFYSK